MAVQGGPVSFGDRVGWKVCVIALEIWRIVGIGCRSGGHYVDNIALTYKRAIDLIDIFWKVWAYRLCGAH